MSKGGAEFIIHDIRSRHAAGANVIAIDFVNAFNSIRRSSILAEVYSNDQLRPLHRLVDLLYGKPSELLWSSGDAGGSVLSSEGVRQGCVLGPALFCIGLAASLHGSPCTTLAYMDDVTIADPDPNRLAAVFNELAARAAQVGLTVNKAKTVTFGPNAAAIASTCGITEGKGAKILGAWIGHGLPEFISKKMREHEVAFKRLREVDFECSYSILRYCAQPRLSHMVRTHEDVMEAATMFDSNILAHVELITGTAAEPHTRQLLHLPIAKGGGGIRQYEWIGPSAYHASLNKIAQDDLNNTIDSAVIDQLTPSVAEHRQTCCKSKSGLWLSGPTDSVKLSNSEFAAALRTRLMCHNKDDTSVTCNCGFVSPSASARDVHVLGCAARRGFGPSTRHNLVRDVVAAIASERGCTVVKEPDLADGRADLAIYAPTLTEPLVVDFTITNTTSSSHPSGAQAEARKKRRYGTSELIVAQADVLGGLSRPFATLISSIATDEDDRAEIATTIAKTIQKGNARIILDDLRKRQLANIVELNTNSKTPAKPWSGRREKKSTRPPTPSRHPTNDHPTPEQATTPRHPTPQRPALGTARALDCGSPPPRTAPPDDHRREQHQPTSSCTGASFNDTQRTSAGTLVGQAASD